MTPRPMASPMRRIDSRVTVTTPEGAELTLAAAGPVARGLAWAVDFVLRVVLFYGAILAMAIAGIGMDSFVPFLVVFAILWLYFTLFEGLTGATPGKRALGVMVVQRDGARCGLEASFVRNLLRAVDSLPFVYGVGLASLLSSSGFQRLGDHAAGTLVVYADASGKRRAKKKKRKGRRPQHDAAAGPRRRNPLSPLAPTVALTGEEEAAVLAFARREGDWGRERAEELAAGAVALTGGATPEQGRIRLLRIARWLQEQGT